MSKSLRKISRGMEKKNIFPSKDEFEAYNLGRDMGIEIGKGIGSKEQKLQDDRIVNAWFAQLTEIPGVGEKLAKRIVQDFNKFVGGNYGTTKILQNAKKVR